MGDPEDKDGAVRVLKAVLHALRNKIPPSTNTQLLVIMSWYLIFKRC